MRIEVKNKKEINTYLLNYNKRIISALIYGLEYLIAELSNHAKSNAGYQDRTSNLKSSIGGMVLQDGKPVTYRGFESEGSADIGSQTGLEFINSLIKDYSQGLVIIVVAGMDYATYVENYYGLNVLKKTELRMQTELPKMLNLIKKRIENANN